MRSWSRLGPTTAPATATLSVSLLVILVYLLGMLTGGSVLMLVRSLFKGARKKSPKTGDAKPV